jgi:hypothetical protein
MTALLSPILGYIFSRDTKRRLIALREAVEVGGILKNKVA